MERKRQQRTLIGAVVGGVLGGLQLRLQNYDFSDSNDVSQAIGFMLGWVGFGAVIGWFSSPKEPE
jgi:hypothetical protein